MPAQTDVELRMDAFATHGNALALVHRDRRITHGELRELTLRTAHALDDHGLVPGAIVVLVAGNEPEALAARYAVNLLGAGVTQPYAGLSAAQRGRIVDDVEAALVLVTPGHTDEAAEVLAHCAPVAMLVLDDDLLAGRPTTAIASRARDADVEQIRHTGGTTGHPKGITYTFGHHRRALEVFRALASSSGGRGPAAGVGGTTVDEHTRQLVATTIAHAAGATADRTLAAGGSVVLLDAFDPGEVLATIARERITHVWLLPPLIYRLLDHPDLDGTDLSSLRCVVYGGAPAAPARLAEACRRIGRVFVQMYGQTESGGISILTAAEHDDPDLLGTVGRVIPTTELAVCDEDGRRVADGATGELWVRTGMEMDGYWKQPELTARTRTPERWMRTGDAGFLDDRGYLHVVDRLGDVVVVVGGHVYTSEVENVLLEHTDVREAAVFGAPSGDGSEEVHAAVVPAPGAVVDDAALTDLVALRQGPMYAPAEIVVVDALPLTDTGKVDKKALRDAPVPQP